MSLFMLTNSAFRPATYLPSPNKWRNSAKEIIDENLILELKMALQSTGMSLKEIADKYRFPDQSFFGRYFKKHTGMSPKEYRAKKN